MSEELKAEEVTKELEVASGSFKGDSEPLKEKKPPLTKVDDDEEEDDQQEEEEEDDDEDNTAKGADFTSKKVKKKG